MFDYQIKAVKNPMTKATVYSASLVPVTPLTLADMAEKISSKCTVTVHDVKAVVSALEEEIGAALLNGNSVRLGDLGSFRPTLRCKAADTKEAFKLSNIKSVNIRFTKGTKFRTDFKPSSQKVKFRNIALATGEEQ